MGQNRGFTLIEIVIVMAIIAIAMAIAGPRIGAGMGRLELNQAAQSVRRHIKIARLQAQRFDREQYVVLDRDRHSVALLGEGLRVVREERLPGSVEVVLDPAAQAATIYVSPSGSLRGNAVRLRGRAGEIEVAAR